MGAMTRPSYQRVGLWSRDRATYRALNSLVSRRWRPEVGSVHVVNGRTIMVAEPRLPYGRATGKRHTDRTVTHIADLVMLAWLNGRLLGCMAKWQCGNTSTEFAFEADVHSRLCQFCWMRAAGPRGYPVDVVITDSVVIWRHHD